MATTKQRDYYGILGVAPTASQDEIRRAFWRLAKLWHPDRYRTAPDHLREQAERRMRLLTEAYSVLEDPERRAEYDRAYNGEVWQARAADDGVAPGAKPFPMRDVGMGIPGYAPSVGGSGPATSDPNGIRIFFGMIFTLIFLAFAGIASRSGDITTAVISGGIAVAVIIVALFIFGRSVEPDQPARQAREDAAQTMRPQSDFEELVQEALDDLPEEFAEQLQNMAIFIEQEPSMDVLRRVGVKPGWTLFGLYEGIPLTKQGVYNAGTPERITLYRGPIERHCLFSPSRIEHQVRATLLHEIAHHFGLDHDEMPIWVKS